MMEVTRLESFLKICSPFPNMCQPWKMSEKTPDVRCSNLFLPPFNWTDGGKAPALGRLSGRVEFRAVRLPVLLLEFFLGSGWDYRIRT
mmetsp:Transcript_42146/g.88104  ORF Transcript_42146/g.88104 Transcript_42146/m.88104 type:complete len:88 (+) Transcript_42146:55-318(+)